MAVLKRAAGLVAALICASSAASAAERLDPAAVYEKSEAAIGRTVGDYALTDSNGEAFRLSAYRGRPLVISLIYTSCSTVCPPTTQHMRTVVAEAQRSLGAERFAVVTLGFDARNDTPARMATFKNTQNVDLPEWRFASADPVTIVAILRDLGFSYVNAAGGFDHVTQTTILDAQGKVYRQIYGEDFPLQVFVEPLKEAIFGLVASSLSIRALTDRIRFICTVYDANVGHYRTSYAVFMGIGAGAISIFLSAWALARAWRSARIAREARDASRRASSSAGAAG
ncbi:MAG: SCO family protein [Rhodoblastus sp.]|nr:SCO family protein [Rhodoblastus sp.]